MALLSALWADLVECATLATLHLMFGLGVSELVVIAVLALLIVGPDGLPNAAKTIGKGIRDLRKQKEDLQNTIEKDTQIGDAVRELRSAMRGDPEPISSEAFMESDSPSINEILSESLAGLDEAKDALHLPDSIEGDIESSKAGVEIVENASAVARDSDDIA